MSFIDLFLRFVDSTAFQALTWQNLVMMGIGGLLIYLAIAKQYEPLLLIPIGFGAILVNLPMTGLLEQGGLLYYFYYGVKIGIFPQIGRAHV